MRRWRVDRHAGGRRSRCSDMQSSQCELKYTTPLWKTRRSRMRGDRHTGSSPDTSPHHRCSFRDRSVGRLLSRSAPPCSADSAGRGILHSRGRGQIAARAMVGSGSFSFHQNLEERQKLEPHFRSRRTVRCRVARCGRARYLILYTYTANFTSLFL